MLLVVQNVQAEFRRLFL